jgi:uncharacterized protein (DUF488 family)
MKIYTSYFAKVGRLNKERIVPISIARFTPKWVSCLNIIDLAPRADMLKMDDATYTREFEKILSRLNPGTILQKIKAASGGNDCALLCYEKPEDFCHRHIVAKWLSDNLGVEVKEFDYEPKKEPDAIQQALF